MVRIGEPGGDKGNCVLESAMHIRVRNEARRLPLSKSSLTTTYPSKKAELLTEVLVKNDAN